VNSKVTLHKAPPLVQAIEEGLQANRIYCIASGEAQGAMKFYMYAQEETKKAIILMEVQISDRILQATIKSDNKEDLQQFKEYFESIVNNEFK